MFKVGDIVRFDALYNATKFTDGLKMIHWKMCGNLHNKNGTVIKTGEPCTEVYMVDFGIEGIKEINKDWLFSSLPSIKSIVNT